MKVIDHISYRKENGFRGLGDLYLPDTVTPETGAALLIHGGGWSALDKSSFAGVALWLCQELGMAAYNINYRLCGQTPWPVCGDDCLEAGDFFLNSAIPEFQGFDRSRIVVIGASAGGHLASVMVTKGCFDIADPTYVKDEIDEEKAVVSAGVLCYPVITLAESYTHKTTAKNFSGGDSAIKTEYSSEKNVTASTAPCFLWCHDKDGTVSSENTRAMQTALLEKNVECEVHIFDDNGATDHGIGIAENFEEAKAWTSLATAFLKNLGF